MKATTTTTTSEGWRDIIDFLVKPDNIEGACDLAEALPFAIDRFHMKFWETLNEIVKTRLSSPWCKWSRLRNSRWW